MTPGNIQRRKYPQRASRTDGPRGEPKVVSQQLREYHDSIGAAGSAGECVAPVNGT